MGTSSSKVVSESASEPRSSGWKTGSKTASIPGPFSTLNSFEKMAKSSDFKDWVCRNLDSDYLVSSILIDTPTSEGLVDNIEFFRTLSPSLNEEISHHINDFELATVAGVDLHLSDTLNVCENELSLRMSAVSSPFFRSFQMRLIALKGIEECIIGEKKLAQEERKIRDYFAADLNSSAFPQLVFVLGLMKCGVNYITVFPKCINLLVDEDQESRNLLIMPIENLCSTICSLSNLQLFSCWSPLRRAPLKKLSLGNSSITASSGNFPGAAIDGKPATYWLCSRSRATWTIELEKSSSNSPGVGVNVVAIQISWRPKQLSAVPHNSAPKKMSIYIKKAKDKTEPGTSEYSRILSVDPELEYGKQNSWTQIYFINCPVVNSIQISVSKQSASNPTNSIKMYSFEVLTEDSESSSVQTLVQLKQVQSALMPLLEYDYLEKMVYDTVLSMIRASGSLSLAVTFIHFIHKQNLDARLKAIAGDSIFMLFESLTHEEHLLKEEAESYSAAESSSVDALFDETAKSALVEVAQCGQVACLSVNKPGNHHCMLAAIMDSGTWTWDFTTMAVKDVTSSFGVVRRPLEDGGEVISPDAWVVRCVDGEVRHGGKVIRPPVGVISPNDVCSFTYDADAETVTLSVNEGDPQLLFEHVPKGISPVVFLSEMGKSVKLLSVTHRRHGSSSRSDSSSTPGHNHTSISSNEITKAEDIQNRPSATLLLRKMARLSKAKMAHLVTQLIESKKKQSSLLDHPYCIEVSADTLHQLVLFLQNVTSTMINARTTSSTSSAGSGCTDSVSTFASTDNELQVLSLLQLIDSQLYCLSCSEVDQASVGLMRDDTKLCLESNTQGHTESMSTIQLLSSLLSMLRQNGTCTEDVRCAASKAFARGSSLFLPTAENKTELILSILKTALRAGALDNATILLLEMLLQKQSRHFEVLQVIELYKRKPHTRPLIHDLLKCLLFILQKNALQIFPLRQAKCKEIFVDNHQCLFPILGQSGFQRIITAFLGRFQEQVINDLTISQAAQDSIHHSNRTADIPCMVELLHFYFTFLADCSLIIVGGANDHEILLKSMEVKKDGSEGCFDKTKSNGKLLPQSGVDRHLRETPLCQLLMPFIHGLVCIATSRDLELVAGILPVATKLLEGFSKGVRTSPSCTVAISAVNNSIRRVIPRPVAPSEVGGWEVVKAAFEDGELSYSASENGTLYTSIHSSNTCGVVSVGFDRTQRAAWEFCLEADSVSDECSVFGAARMPISSRCYSSSADLWMRRAYNGYMYAQGQPRGAAMEKIHPNDIVRIEFDGPAGTLSFSLNGSEPIVGFQDITETIYPACGSYRSAVKIRLLKVEVYGAGNVDPENIPGVNNQCPYSSLWVLDKALQHSQEPSILTSPKSADCVLDGKSWLTARGNRGAVEGVHDWSFELLHRSHAPFALGVVVGGELCTHDVLGGPCVVSADMKAVKAPSSKRAHRDASSAGVLSPPRVSSSLPPTSPASSNWSEMRTSAPAERRGRFLLNRRRGRNRSDSDDDDRERDRERDREGDDSRSRVQVAPTRSPTRSTVSAAVAFQRLLRAAAPVFVPANPQPTAPENDLNVDLDEILATFLSTNNSDMTHIFQQTTLPTSFLSLDTIPFAQETPVETDAVLDLRPPEPGPSDIAMAALFVDGVAQMEQSALEARIYERYTLSSAAELNTATEGPSSSTSTSTVSTAVPTCKSVIENCISAGEIKVDSTHGDKTDITHTRSNYGDGMLAMAWHSDGSLWVNGLKLAEGFGSKFLPLDRMSSISIRVNRTERTVTYFVNGVYVGIAFGPEGTDAAVHYALPTVVTTDGSGSGCTSHGHAWGRNIVYPAGSISLPAAKDMPTSALHSIKLKSSGFNGSIVLPLQLTLQKSCASVVGRLSSILLAGPVLDAEEISLMCWLKSPLLIGGMDDDVSLYSDDSVHSDPRDSAVAVSHVGNSQKIANSEDQDTDKEIEVGLEKDEVIEEKKDKEMEKEKAIMKDDSSIETKSVNGSFAKTKDFHAKVDVIEAEEEEVKVEENGEVKEKEKGKGKEKEIRRRGEFPPSWSEGRDRIIGIGGGGGAKGSEGGQTLPLHHIMFHH